MDFESLKIADLHAFLKKRNVTYSGKRKQNLVDLCKACENIKLPIDPDYTQYDNKKELSRQLDCLKIEILTTLPFILDSDWLRAVRGSCISLHCRRDLTTL